jgi:hypothetical protein
MGDIRLVVFIDRKPVSRLSSWLLPYPITRGTPQDLFAAREGWRVLLGAVIRQAPPHGVCRWLCLTPLRELPFKALRHRERDGSLKLDVPIHEPLGLLDEEVASMDRNWELLPGERVLHEGKGRATVLQG